MGLRGSACAFLGLHAAACGCLHWRMLFKRQFCDGRHAGSGSNDYEDDGIEGDGTLMVMPIIAAMMVAAMLTEWDL